MNQGLCDVYSYKKVTGFNIWHIWHLWPADLINKIYGPSLQGHNWGLGTSWLGHMIRKTPYPQSEYSQSQAVWMNYIWKTFDLVGSLNWRYGKLATTKRTIAYSDMLCVCLHVCIVCILCVLCVYIVCACACVCVCVCVAQSLSEHQWDIYLQSSLFRTDKPVSMNHLQWDKVISHYNITKALRNVAFKRSRFSALLFSRAHKGSGLK